MSLTLPRARRIVRAMRTVLVLVLSVTALAGCGLRGDLVRPMPLWGDPPLDGPDDPRVIQAAEDAKKAEEERQAEERRAADAARREQMQNATNPGTDTPPQ